MGEFITKYKKKSRIDSAVQFIVCLTLVMPPWHHGRAFTTVKCEFLNKNGFKKSISVLHFNVTRKLIFPCPHVSIYLYIYFISTSRTFLCFNIYMIPKKSFFSCLSYSWGPLAQIFQRGNPATQNSTVRALALLSPSFIRVGSNLFQTSMT